MREVAHINSRMFCVGDADNCIRKGLVVHNKPQTLKKSLLLFSGQLAELL